MSVMEILQQAEALNDEERQELIQHLMNTLAPSTKTRHLSELRGLGKELWQGIDTEEYLNQLRDEWDVRP